MKHLILAFSLIFSFGSMAQTISVKVSGNIFNTNEDSVFVSQFFSTHYVDFIRTAIDDDGNFSVEGSLPNPDFYVLRLGEDRINLIMRDESDVKIYADGNNINALGNIIGSDESQNMKDFILLNEYWNMKKNEGMAAIEANPAQEIQIKSDLDKEYANFINNRRSFIAQNPNSPILLVALSTIDPNTDWATYDMVARQLESSLPGSVTIESAYKQYLQIKQQKEAMAFLSPGKPAPDFEEKMADGKTMKLSDLKGKVILLDFWASWCGPCRRENPNVVELYEKYKSKGFTVLSVSLDQSRDRWLQAIKQDNLTWPYHVSDLKGWSSKVAQQYQVRGIPFTVLIDQEGNIIDTKLRGAELEKELSRLFD